MNKRTLIVIRHVWAGDPDKWKGKDRNRPIDDRGEQEAYWLAKELGRFPVDKLYSSEYLRCWQTLIPYSFKALITIKRTSALNIGASGKEALKLAKNNQVTVVCTHGDVGPKILYAAGHEDDERKQNKKGSYWVIKWQGKDVDYSYFEPPKFKEK